METVKEKLAALLTESRLKPVRLEGRKLIRPASSVEIADHLIQNGVTLQDTKPLNEFLAPIDEYQGLKQKYLVFKADSGERVMDCFVLRPQKDSAAAEALRSYANATDNKVLAEDIRNWIGEGEPLQDADKWVSVEERPIARPLEEWHEDYGDVLWWKFPIEEPPYVGSPLCSDWPEYHTHWTPLPPYPEPPKGAQ